MDIVKEINLFAAERDKPILLWLFERYHWASEWRAVAHCTFQRYGRLSYEVNRVWAPTPEGRAIASTPLLLELLKDAPCTCPDQDTGVGMIPGHESSYPECFLNRANAAVANLKD